MQGELDHTSCETRATKRPQTKLTPFQADMAASRRSNYPAEPSWTLICDRHVPAYIAHNQAGRLVLPTAELEGQKVIHRVQHSVRGKCPRRGARDFNFNIRCNIIRRRFRDIHMDIALARGAAREGAGPSAG